MYFRYQGFMEGRELVGGWIRSESKEEARRRLEEIVDCIVQLTPSRSSLGRPLGESGPDLTLDSSEQFIPVEPPQPRVVRGASGARERNLIGHVEMYGGAEYVQLFLLVTVYLFSAYLLWAVFPPMGEAEFSDWVSEDQRAKAEGFDNVFMKAAVLTLGNSALSMVVLLFMLALKRSVFRMGVIMIAVYGFQWFSCFKLGGARIEDGAGTAYYFMASHPFYTLAAWGVPIILMIVVERVSRRVLDMTVPVYEDPETGRIEVEGGDVRGV